MLTHTFVIPVTSVTQNSTNLNEILLKPCGKENAIFEAGCEFV